MDVMFHATNPQLFHSISCSVMHQIYNRNCIKYITEIVYVLGEQRAAWAASHLHVRDASLGSRSLFSAEIEVMAPFVT